MTDKERIEDYGFSVEDIRVLNYLNAKFMIATNEE